ncbi:MAG: LysR family transcriptional regulator [Peptostreptococcaceae bacterium]|nr:LysR family transcriptional regulator [Peptostreptococcaceae bacterium]
MHIESLKYFYEVVRIKSISKAASNAHISQSALSQQIQKLEDSMGHKLLIRSNKGVELTPMGNIVLKYAENIFRTYEKMQEEMKNAEKSDQLIKIEACWSISDYALPCALYVIKKKFPYHNYEMVSNSSFNIEEEVMNDLCDFGFMCTEPLLEELEVMKVGNDELVLVALNSDQFPDSVSIKDVVKLPFIMLTEKFNIRRKILDEFKKAGFGFNDLNTVFSLDSMESVKASVQKGYGVSVVPYMAVKKELYTKKLKVIDIVDRDLKYDIFFIHKKGTDSNTVEKEFMERFKELGKKSFC